MQKYTTPRTAVALMLILLAMPAMLLATEPGTEPAVGQEQSTVVIVGDDGEELNLTLFNGELTVTTTDNGKTTTSVMDLEAVGLLTEQAVGLAMLEFDGVLEHLQDMQLQVRLGQDNRLNVNCAESAFELDLDQVMTQVASAVQLGLQEIDASEWTNRSNRWDEASDDDLRDELDNLKDEMKELRRELRRLQKDDD